MADCGGHPPCAHACGAAVVMGASSCGALRGLVEGAGVSAADISAHLWEVGGFAGDVHAPCLKLLLGVTAST